MAARLGAVGAIVIHTTPGSASLVARHLDRARPAGILGTIAGDDTLLVIPRSVKSTKKLKTILARLFGIDGAQRR
jgi:transcriptional regulator of arginine metabolism